MATVEKTRLRGERRIVLSGVSWELYEQYNQYVERECSLNLPMLRVKDPEPFLDFELAADESAWNHKFRNWVRERFADR